MSVRIRPCLNCNDHFTYKICFIWAHGNCKECQGFHSRLFDKDLQYYYYFFFVCLYSRWWDRNEEKSLGSDYSPLHFTVFKVLVNEKSAKWISRVWVGTKQCTIQTWTSTRKSFLSQMLRKITTNKTNLLSCNIYFNQRLIFLSDCQLSDALLDC